MNQLTTRFIISVTGTVTREYAWTVKYQPGAGGGPRREASGTQPTRKQAIAAAIREAGNLAHTNAEGVAA